MKRYPLTLLLALLALTGASQNLVTYTDTLNHFSIGTPEGWLYKGSPGEPGIKFYAVRRKTDQKDSLQENFNVNIIVPRTNISLDITYNRFYKVISSGGNFNFVDSGSATINNIPFKWLIEKHKEEIANGVQLELVNYDFVTYHNNKTYIITLVAPPATFEKYKTLLKKIAESFRLE